MDTTIDVHLLVSFCFFIPCALFIAVFGGALLRLRSTPTNDACISESTHAIALTLEPPSVSGLVQSEKHHEIIEQLALQSTQLAERVSSLNDVVNATMSLAESVTVRAAASAEDAQLNELVQQVRVVATGMVATVQSLRVSTDNMQEQVAQIAASLERVAKISIITFDTQ